MNAPVSDDREGGLGSKRISFRYQTSTLLVGITIFNISIGDTLNKVTLNAHPRADVMNKFNLLRSDMASHRTSLNQLHRLQSCTTLNLLWHWLQLSLTLFCFDPLAANHPSCSSLGNFFLILRRTFLENNCTDSGRKIIRVKHRNNPEG